MKFTSYGFLKTLMLVHLVKYCNANCEKNKGDVICESISVISDRELSKVSGINEVKRIRVRLNPNLTLDTNAFRSAVKLEHIFINNNKISRIAPNAFRNLPVKILNLENNGISYIYPEAFVSLSSLEKLQLQNNNLKVIPLGLYNNLPITELALSRNKISVIEDNTMRDLPNLKKLKLDNNNIESIFIHRILMYPSVLEILWLHNNSITTISNYMLQGLSNLKVLNLGFNAISIIEALSFEQTPMLNYLILTHNRLKEIDGRVFPRTSMRYLDKIYLDNNKLMYLSSSFFVRLGNLRKITLVGNPWICPCLNDVQKLLAENKVMELCNEEYTSGGRPICVNDKPSDNVCRYSYNDQLSQKYENYKINNPAYRPVIPCFL